MKLVYGRHKNNPPSDKQRALYREALARYLPTASRFVLLGLQRYFQLDAKLFEDHRKLRPHIAQELGDMLEETVEERRKYEIKTIRPCHHSADQFKELQRENRRCLGRRSKSGGDRPRMTI
jgi:hypothetical protein